jgi:hypothetical protein
MSFVRAKPYDSDADGPAEAEREDRERRQRAAACALDGVAAVLVDNALSQAHEALSAINTRSFGYAQRMAITGAVCAIDAARAALKRAKAAAAAEPSSFPSPAAKGLEAVPSPGSASAAGDHVQAAPGVRGRSGAVGNRRTGRGARP